MRFWDRLFGGTPSDPAEELIGWLAGKNLDDRNIVAGILYGGPHSLRVLKWILSRPDCDKGTAAMLLWEFGLPYAIVRDDSRFPLDREVQIDLVSFIVSRWRAGLFADSVFAFDPRENAIWYRRELKKKGLKGTDPLDIPDEAWRPLAGRRPVGTDVAALKPANFMDGVLGELRLADLAAINPDEWSR